MARLYALILLVLWTAGSCFYVYQRPSFDMMTNPLYHHNIESKVIDAKWTDYLQDCGGEKVIENFVHTKMLFNEKYENNQIRWTGYFAEVKNKAKGIWMFGNDHHLSLLVKMSPSESNVFADLALSVSSELYM